MSSFHRLTKNPASGEFENAIWIDDYYGRHRYGVQFPDGTIYRQSDHNWVFGYPDDEQAIKSGATTADEARARIGLGPLPK
jgi:hypothetical protein